MIDHYLSAENLKKLMEYFELIVNTIDFDSPIFPICQDIAKHSGKTLFFPINFSTIGGTVAVFEPDSPTLESVLGPGDHNAMKKKILIHWIEEMKRRNVDTSEITDNYMNNEDRPPYDPQTGHGVYDTAALVAKLMLKIVKGQRLETFPYVYLESTMP